MMGHGAAAHIDITPVDVNTTDINMDVLVDILGRRDSLAWAINHTTAALVTQSAWFNDRIRFQLSVCHDHTQAHARAKFRGHEDLRVTHLTKTGTNAHDPDAHGHVRQATRRYRLSFTHALTNGRIVGDGLPAHIFNKAGHGIGQLGPEDCIKSVVGVESIVMPVGSFNDTAIRTARDAHGQHNNRFAFREIIGWIHQGRSIFKALNVTDRNTIDT